MTWLQEQQAFAPEKPFFMYWAPGASHGPHQVMKSWADKYKGKFDDGWDKYRERVFARQKELGWIPKDAKLTPRSDTLASWDSIPEAEKPFQRRLMEVFAGFTEHADAQAGRVIDEIERQGKLDNTLIFYIWGDNGSSAEGQNDTISELLAQNGIKTTIPQHLKVLEELGGLDALGSAKTDNMYHAGWAWAGSTPYRSTKLVASHLGGTRQPMAVCWPKGIQPDAVPRPQFHHVIDIAPTILEVAKITPPRTVNGIPQDDIDGVSMAYTFADPKAEGRRKTQFFDVMGSRGVYHDGWFASAFGPRVPWLPGLANVKDWNPEQDVWELYNLDEDWTQANDLAAKMPDKLAEMKSLFLVESAKNKNLPIGGGLWTAALDPEDGPGTPYTEWTFSGNVGRMPEFAAPKLQRAATKVVLEVDAPENANGVLYALGGFSAGLACYVEKGVLTYEYNLFMMERTVIKSAEKLPPGKVTIEIDTTPTVKMISSPLDVVLKVNGQAAAKGRVPVSASIFNANECLDFGRDLDSPVSKAYYDQAPFPFTGKILNATVTYPK